jgi:hypothetical protein
MNQSSTKLQSQAARALIRFPAVQYFEPRPKAETPVTKILVGDWNEAFNVTVGRRWPRYENYVPGGLLDHAGQHFRIIGLLNWEPCPWWLLPLDWFCGMLPLIGPFELDPLLEGPEQLTLEEFKQRLCKLVGRERNLHSGGEVGYRGLQKRIRDAPDYERCICALYGRALYSHEQI